MIGFDGPIAVIMKYSLISTVSMIVAESLNGPVEFLREVEEGDGMALRKLQVYHVFKPLQVNAEDLHHKANLMLRVFFLLAKLFFFVSHRVHSPASLDFSRFGVGALDAVIGIYMWLGVLLTANSMPSFRKA